PCGTQPVSVSPSITATGSTNTATISPACRRRRLRKFMMEPQSVKVRGSLGGLPVGSRAGSPRAAIISAIGGLILVGCGLIALDTMQHEKHHDRGNRETEPLQRIRAMPRGQHHV